MQAKVPEDNFHKHLIDNLYDGVYFVDVDRRITYWNRGAERITGYLSEMVVGTFCNNNLLNHITDNGKHLCEDGCPLLETIRDGREREAEVLGALSAAPAVIPDLVAQLYPAIDPRVRGAAGRSVLAHLEKLAAEGRARREGEAWHRANP